MEDAGQEQNPSRLSNAFHSESRIIHKVTAAATTGKFPGAKECIDVQGGWFTTVILATWKVEFRRTAIRDQPRQKARLSPK
jgi:hypothetical protein